MFTVTQVKEFANTSLANYYQMFSESEDEFEDYVKENDASLFIIYMDPTDQTEKQNTYPLKFDGEATDVADYGYPFSLNDTEFKDWVRSVQEF
jgi:hypothetical protein